MKKDNERFSFFECVKIAICFIVCSPLILLFFVCEICDKLNIGIVSQLVYRLLPGDMDMM